MGQEKCDEINIDGIYAIVKDNNILKTKFIKFNFKPELEQKINNLRNDLKTSKKRIENKEIKLEDCKQNLQNKIDETNNTIKNTYPDFFEIRDYVSDISSSYSKMVDYSYKDWKKITDDIDSLSSVSSYYPLFVASYKHELLRKTFSNMNVLAYTHRKTGWNNDHFPLDNNFSIDVFTNFGYGGSSYFDLLIKYKDIKIIPYTVVIYYKYANASSVLHATKKFDVLDESWIKCFDFVIDEINLFNQKGRESYILSRIKIQIEELCSLFEIILNKDVFYFTDISKLDNIFDLDEKKIIYDYEHLIHNVNPYAINEEALEKFVVEFEKLKYSSFLNTSNEKMLKELSDFVLNSNAQNSIKQSDTNKEKYGYALSMLLSKYYQKFNEWGELNDETYSARIQTIVKKILNVEQNYDLLMYRYSGFNLVSFRNERMQLCFELFDNIRSLKEILNSNIYINRLKNSAKILRSQNEDYYQKLITKWEKAKNDYELKNYELLKEKDKFEKTVEYKQHNFYEYIFDSLYKINSLFVKDSESQRIIVSEELEEFYENTHKFINDSSKYIVLTKVYGLNEYGSNSNYFSYSIGSIRKRWENATVDKEEKYKALQKALELNMSMEKIFDKFFNSDNYIDFKNYLLEEMVELKKLEEDLYKTGFGSKPNNVFNLYNECYINNSEYYNEINNSYNEAIKPIKKLKDEVNELEKLYKSLNSQKESIEIWNKKIEEELNND